MVTLMVSWGHKPRPNYGKRRPRPILCKYSVSTAPPPAGSSANRPFPRSCIRKPKNYVPLPDPMNFLLPDSSVGDVFVDGLIQQYIAAINKAEAVMHQLHKRELYSPNPMKAEGYKEKSMCLWDTFNWIVRSALVCFAGITDAGFLLQDEIPLYLIEAFVSQYKRDLDEAQHLVGIIRKSKKGRSHPLWLKVDEMVYRAVYSKNDLTGAGYPHLRDPVPQHVVDAWLDHC